VEIRSLGAEDVEAVLDLNAASVDATSPLDAATLRSYLAMSDSALVCVVDDRVAAFAIAYAPRSAYPSVNYRWHDVRFDDFLYLDRIVVGSAYRRRGIATALYDALELVAAQHGRMVCEVNCEPPNLESLAFHRNRGYVEIGELAQADGHRVVMLEKALSPAP
jgi:predicted GNAT superfamily acetyltransferase